MQEMFRVTKPGGVLGLATWGDPRFGKFHVPWEKACRELLPDYEPPALMDPAWTWAANVQNGLEKGGFKDVVVWVEDLVWRWESGEALARYFFEGGNPFNVMVIESFEKRGGDVKEVRRIYERVVTEELGKRDGTVEIPIPATLATARV